MVALMLFFIISPVLYIPLPALYIPLPRNRLPIKDDPNVPNNIGIIGKAPPFLHRFVMFYLLLLLKYHCLLKPLHF